MRSSRLVLGLLVTAVALSACKSDPPTPPEEGTPVLADTVLAETTVGASYTSTVSASGGTSPYTFTAQGLPPGIALASSGALSGTASAAGDFQLQVTVKDAHDKQASKTFPLKVYPPVSFSQTALPTAAAGTAYSTTLDLEGGKAPLTVRLASGTLPAGVNFNANTRQLAGTFPTAGTFPLTFEATDVHGAKTSQSYVLTVTGSLRITLTDLPVGNVGSPYSQLITTSGGTSPLTASLDSGALPAGLAFTADTLAGTPTAGGHFSFVIKVTDAQGATATLATTMDIYANPPPRITTSSLPDGSVGSAYSQTLAGADGTTPYTFTVTTGALPAGVQLSTSGVLSGTPTAAGAATFEVTLTDSKGQLARHSFSLTVYAPPALTSLSPLPGAYAGQPYSFTFAATGGQGTLTFSRTSGTLPTGLTLSASGALGPSVNGSVAQGAVSTFTVTVTDNAGRTGSKSFDLTTYKVPQLTSTTLTTATEGVAYRRSEASAESVQAQLGQGALVFSATGLPQGLSIDSSTGELSGTPAQGSAGAYSVTFTVTDTGGQSSSKALSLQVVKPQPTPYGGTVGLAPAGSRITDTLTVFATTGRVPLAGVGVRVRKNGVEYSPAMEAVTNAAGKVVFTGLGLNGTTDTVDVTANGKELVNATFASINASIVTVRLYSSPVLGPRVLSSNAYDPSTRRFFVYGGYDSTTSNSLFYTTCLNDMVEAVDVAQKSFVTRVPGGLTTSPPGRFDGGMAIAGGKAVLFGGRKCIDTGDSLGDTWEFDLSTNSWASITPAGAKPSPRRNPFYSNEVWRYEPATHTWLAQTAAPFSRAWMGSASQTVTGELWFCGGRTPASAECQAFKPSTGTWSVKPSLPTGLSELAMAFDPFTETLYAFGGRLFDSAAYGGLLRLPKGASAWETVIPPGATPPPRYGHLMYFDQARRELVVGLGLTVDPSTSRSTRLSDVWTYDGQAWTERAPPATVLSYTVSGQVTGGPASGQAIITLGTSSGAVSTATVNLDAQGRGTYAIANVAPGEPLFMTVTGYDYNLSYPNTLWNYTELQHAGLAADATVNFNLPTGPAVLLQATGRVLLPASWHNQAYTYQVDAQLELPGYPALRNGTSTLDEETYQYGLAFTASAAPHQQHLYGYFSSEQVCEDHGLYGTIAAGTVNLSLNAPATAVSPGQPECIPQGPRGVGPARVRFFASAPQRVSVADLDGDTLPELLIPQPTGFSLGIVRGTPSVTSAFADFDCCDTLQAHSVATGDFNKDGRIDVAVTEPSTNSVQVMFGQATPPRSLGAPTAYPVGASPSGLAAADVNGDGFVDLLAANQGANTVSILYGGSNGTFSTGPVVTLAGTSPTQVLVTNVDGDSLPDLAVVMAEGISLSLDGSTQGPFGNSTLVAAGTQPRALVVGRLNGDTLPDLAVANAGSNTVSLLFGAGGGNFAQPVSLATAATPSGLVLAELTGDAHLDLAVASPTEATVTLYQGASNGTFTQHSKVPVPGDPRGLTVVDFNGDGLNDLAVASPTANGVYLLMGQKPAPTASGNLFSFSAPANASFMWSLHAVEGQRRTWDYYAPLQAGPVSYSLPLASTLAPSSAPVAPSNGKLELSWTPWVKQWEPTSPQPFNPRQFSLANLGLDADTQPGASHYFWP